MMHRIYPGRYIIFILFAVTLAWNMPSFGETRGKDSIVLKDKQMIIVSNSMEIDDQKNLVVFTGNVNARGKEFKITCQKLDLYYHQPKPANPQIQKIEVKKIVASGGVEIFRAEGGTATAEKAVYFQDEEKVVLTGNPKIRQEKDFVEGTKITLFLKEKKSIVEGSEKNQVKAVVGVPASE